MADSHHILRPIPRRAFELTPVSTDSSLPPSPPTEQMNPDLLMEKKSDMLSSPSRTRSILNLTSSTLLGIYSPTGHDGSREESSTPWGTGAQTPSHRHSMDDSRPQPSMLTWNTLTQRPSAPQRRPKPGILPTFLRSSLLFAFGVAYGSIITQLHKSQNITPVRVPGVDGHSWYQHIAWGLSGLFLGNMLPWVDLRWADEESSVENERIPLQRRRSSRGSAGNRDMSPFANENDFLGGDWYSAVRSVGAFVGIAFAVRKLPWQSTLQVSLTLALANPFLWYLIDRSKAGFVFSTAVGLVGTLFLLLVNPELVPLPATAQQPTPISESLGVFIWMASWAQSAARVARLALIWDWQNPDRGGLGAFATTPGVQACGDVFTKKKLDPHRNQCRGAYFTCLDCMVTFNGTDYRSHTVWLSLRGFFRSDLNSCMTEDQKYQGALYREKPTKAGKRKSVSIVEPNESKALVPRAAYVEDVPDADAPPHVPSPPPAVPDIPAEGVNVFDFLVTEDSPNPSRTLVNGKKSQVAAQGGSTHSEGKELMRHSYRNSEELLHDKNYVERGFTYGAEPVNPRPYRNDNGSLVSLEFMTPAAKATRAKLDRKDRPMSASHSRTNSGSEKKRKRGFTDELTNGNDVTRYELEGDTLMPDAPYDNARSDVETPALAHSGLTGGLTRLLSNSNDEYPFPPSPEYEKDRERERDRRQSHKHEDPASPLKRSRHSKDDGNGLGISIKGRAGRVMSLMGGTSVGAALAALTNPAAAANDGGYRESPSVKTRPRGSSSEHGQNQSREREGEKRDRKKHKVHRHNGTSSSNVRHERRGSRRRGSNESPEAGRRKMKAIEYRPDDSGSDSEDARNRGENSQMVVFGAQEVMRTRCETFLSYVTKGPDSEKGCSMNKALKRWHRDADTRSSSSKHDVEKELWKSLRLKKNENGEIVVFAA